MVHLSYGGSLGEMNTYCCIEDTETVSLKIHKLERRTKTHTLAREVWRSPYLHKLNGTSHIVKRVVFSRHMADH